MSAIADFFVASDEFQTRYPESLSNTAFVTALYANMLNREADAGGLDYWVGRLDAGDSRGTVLANFANTLENQNSNPVRKAALQSFIAFIAADANQTISTSEAATWLAANPGLDGAVVDGTGGSEAPQRIELVAATSLQGDQIQLDWLATFANGTPGSPIHYRLHASLTPRFVPTSATVYAEVVDAVSATLTGVTPETRYYVKVEVPDSSGASRWSNELSVTTAASTPNASSETRQVLDATSAPGQTVTADQVRYQLPAGQTVPDVGDLLVSPEGEGYLRRATSVSQSGSQVTVQTEPAALNEAFDDLQFSTDVRLIDVPQTAGGRQAVSSGLRTQQHGATRQVTWPASGLTLMQTEPPAPVSARTSAGLAPAATDRSVACDGTANGQRRVSTDAPLQVTYPGAVCVEPGSQLSMDISAEIQSGSEADYEVTQLLFLEMTHPKVSKTTENYGAEWEPNTSGSDAQGKGILRWTPQEAQVDDQARPYTARFVAIAKEREGHCTGGFGWYCETRRIEFEVPIVVGWGELPRPEEREVSGGNSQITFDATVTADFQPTIRTEANIQRGRLDSARLVIEGPVAFESQVRVQASAQGFYANSQTLVDKRFIKIFWAGGVPIIMNGRFILNLEYQARADAALDLTETLNVGYDLVAGLEYRDGAWRVLQEAQPWQRFRLSGEADTHAYAELRFVPDVQVTFYEVATGRLILEPYLYAAAALEGHFRYDVQAGGGVTQGSDADYRFTQLEFGGGLDGKFRLGLEVFDTTIIGYPSRDPNDFHEFALIERTPIIGLPTLTPHQTTGSTPQDCRAVALTADVENMPNPFQGLFGGPATFNAFEDGSAQWEVVMPGNGTQLMPGATAREAWFSADASGPYTLRFSGYSALGSFIRQYQDLTVNFDAGADQCGGGDGPAMITLPGGTFLMGSPTSEEGRWDNEQQRTVTVASFAIGKYEVTFDEYDRFAEATGRAKPEDWGWGRGRRPVITVDWFDATAYAQWLSQQTGLNYRLPTEAEWEYAARAGTTSPFWTGNCVNTDQANYYGQADYGSPDCGANTGVYRGQTLEVGAFPANPWGLHDMMGNVWEWTCSLYEGTYAGQEQVCNTNNITDLRMCRGGSYRTGPQSVRSALRCGFGPFGRSLDLGFRLARSL